MSKPRTRTDWTLAGPPDAVLRPHGKPRRPFSIIRYWMPGAVLGAALVAVGVWTSLNNDEVLPAWWGLLAGIGALQGYLLPMKRALGRTLAVATALSVLPGVAFVLWIGVQGLIVCAVTASVSIPIGLIGVFPGLTLREVARGRWYHARFLPLAVMALGSLRI